MKEYDQSELAYRRALESTSHDSDLVPMWQGLADVFAAKNNPKSEVEANEHLVSRMHVINAYSEVDVITRSYRMSLYHCIFSCTAAPTH